MKRFWEKVKKTEYCWEWTGAKDQCGYGQMAVPSKSTPSGRTSVKAHRVSWEIENGPIPKGLLACHKCDNPGCVRPSHLFLGTDRDNKIDSVKKGRAYTGGIPPVYYGEEHPNNKLKEAQVREILLRYTGKYGNATALGREFCVSRTTIYRIANGDNWKWLK